MTTSILINALGQALFESCGQALLIYVALQLFMQFFPTVGSKYKYDINYLGLTIISCWFLANLVNIYLHDVEAAKVAAVNCSTHFIYGITYMPTMLQQAEGFIAKYASYITGLYFIGLSLHGFRLLGGFVHLHQIRRQKNLKQDSLWSAKANQLAEKLKMVNKVALYFSEHIQIPLTIGHLKPIIIFPMALINNLDNDQVEAILLHELSHIKRHDYLLNILQCIMETILCFNPFVWLISKTIREQREYCCDDMVIDEECNNFSYSKALFIIAQQNNQRYSLAMASAASKKYPLLNRIKRLNTMTTNETLPKFNLLIIVAVASIGALLAWGIPQYSAAKAVPHQKTKSVTYHLDKMAMSAPEVAVTTSANHKPKHVNARIVAYNDTATNNIINDTAKHKTKFKIVISEDGKDKEYTSVDEMPEADRKAFLEENPSFKTFNNFKFDFKDSMKFANMAKFKMSPEFRKSMADMKLQAENIRKQFNSPQWKKQVKEMQAQADKMHNNPEWQKQMDEIQAEMHAKFDTPGFRKQMDELKDQMHAQFDSPEWKKQMSEISETMHQKFDNPEFKKQMADMSKKMQEQFNSPEWKKQMTDIKIQAEKMQNNPALKKQMKDMKKQSEEMRKQFNSPEWKKKMEDIEKTKSEIDEHIRKETDKARDESEQKAEQDSVKTPN